MAIVSSGNQSWTMKETFNSLNKAYLQIDLIDQTSQLKVKEKINFLSSG